MNRVAECFLNLKHTNRKAVIPYIMGGDPGLAETAERMIMLDEAGADLIEVGVPFSDPLADGPVIQAAGQRALQNGCTMERLLATVGQTVSKLKAPIILMVYYNLVFQRGIERFLADCAANGVAGLIIPDLLPEDAGDMIKLGEQYGIGLNFLVAPTSSAERIRAASEASSGFLYAVSVKGVTGVRAGLSRELPDFLRAIRTQTAKPLAVGFGIGTVEQAKQVTRFADGAIVGSALIQTAILSGTFAKAADLVRELKKGLE